jgi:hypothetical protein
MFIKIDCYQFADRMGDDFSRDAAIALFDYLEDLESDCGEEQEFDRVGIRCQFSEYASALEAATDHRWSPEADMYDADDNERSADEIQEENNQLALNWLRDRTTVIEFEGGVIIGDF